MEKTVYFRAFEEEDADLIYQWMNDDELKSLSVGLNRRMSREECLSWIRNKKNHNSYDYYWAICSKESNKLIGYMSLTDIHYINRSGNFSGILIGDSDYRNGIPYIESLLFMFEFAFERLNLNRLYGSAIAEHKLSVAMGEAMFQKREGLLRQAVYKNGRYYDEVIHAILKDEYLNHKENGEYELMSIIRRLKNIRNK